MKQFIRDYFTFNRRERNGVFILLSIILLLIVYLSFSGYFISNGKIDFSKFEKEISDFEKQQKKIEDSVVLARRLGFSDSETYEKDSSVRFRPFSFSKNQFYSKPFSSAKRETIAGTIELNSADTNSLKSLNGIGSVFAKRIIKFRDALGGFVRKEQLLEVYGIDAEKLQAISPKVEIDISKVKRININTASVDDLRKHPYLNKKVAVSIFSRRISKGDFKDVQEVKELNFVSDSLYNKIAPYLRTD